MAERDSKGTFSDRRLPVAQKYVIPISRSRMVWGGLALAGVLLLLVAVDAFVGDGDVISAGPVSRAHAALEERGSCDSCHVALASASSEKCQDCHGFVADGRSAFGHASHVLYQSSDLQRVTDHENDAALECTACHTEHQGRDANITEVADARCGNCHFGGFDEHPQFAFARLHQAKERPGLAFPHVKHVRKLVEKNDLAQIETACLYCHQSDETGAGFVDIDFEMHCSSKGCHAQGKEKTPFLPTFAAGRPGVLTPEMIARSGRPGTSWAKLEDPTAYPWEDGQIRKLAQLHPDPWVMENLRHLARQRRSGPVLADLLLSSPGDAHNARALYAEAIETLSGWIDELRSSPDKQVQKDLEWASSMLESLERQLENPFELASAEAFEALDDVELDPATEEALDEIEAGLTKWCSECHGVANGAIVRPQADQEMLVRANFDHRAHALQQGCLDCHSSGYNAGVCEQDPSAEFDWRTPFCLYVSPMDTSDPANPKLVHPERHDLEVADDFTGPEWVNLPGVESCRSCHSSKEAGDSCTTCHEYHPHKDRGAHLSRFLGEGDES
ncbi:MAG: hypothetical protein QNK05_17145 [Myxococcota bacterium]|nr:hypothetical protein [Myxococcota bacterium]